jgi:hypothetical protein
LLENFVTVPLNAFAITYSWLYQNLVAPFMAFSKDFEFAVICTVTLIFILVSVFLMFRQMRRLPKSYVVEIVDVYGEKVSIDGIRQMFKTYDAAESYARMYRQNMPQYKFTVVGLEKELAKS